MNNIVNFTMDILLMGIGFYVIKNHKALASKIDERSPDSIKISNFEYKFHRGKNVTMVLEYGYLLSGIIMMIIGIYLLLHMIKIV